MRKFIRISDNIFDAEREGRIVSDRYKPKPHKEWRELTFDELVYSSHRTHLIILFHGAEDKDKKIQKSMANFLVDAFPELAEKLNLQLDRTDEYWR